MKKLAILLPCLVLATASHGALLLSETFDGLTTGGLNGQNSWTADSGVDVTAGGLDYSSGTLSIDGGANHVQNSVLSDALVPVAQKGFTGQSSDVWFSFTFNVDSTANNNDRYWFLVSDDPSINAGDTVAFGDRNTSGSNLNGSYRVNTSEVGLTANVALTLQSTYFVVGRWSKDGVNGGAGEYDLAEFWVNPNSTTLGASTLTVDANGNATGGIDTFGLTVLGTGPDILWDNVRIGTTQADVLDVYLVPEPAASLLLGLGGLGLVLRRRRQS